MMPSDDQVDEEKPVIRRVQIGSLRVDLSPMSSELAMAIDLRNRMIAGTEDKGEVLDAIQDVIKDALVGTVINPDDIGKIISELASKRVGREDLLRALTGVDESQPNREDRRANEHGSTGRARNGRSRGSGRGRGRR
jgi:hypothetical protein